MKAHDKVTVTRGKLSGHIGVVKEPHANLPGFWWCWLSNRPPFPQPGFDKPAPHHSLKVISEDQLSAL